MDIENIMQKLVEGYNLSNKETYEMVKELDRDNLTDSQIGAFLATLTYKGPVIEEITGLVKGMREVCKGISPDSSPLIDTCGTGGGLTTFNISTINALVIANKIGVAKHGSRSISSKSGSADVLEELGINIEIPPGKAEKMIEDINIAFLFAPLFHPVMGRVLKPESELGIKTVFYTMIGPLINPANTKRHVLGVYRPDLVNTVAEIVSELDYEHVLVVHGVDGLDEISPIGKTRVAEVRGDDIEKYNISPEDFGIDSCSIEDVKGGSPEYNARIMEKVLSGKECSEKNAVLLNSSAALYAGGCVSSIQDGIELARNLIDEGEGKEKLREFIIQSNSLEE